MTSKEAYDLIHETMCEYLIGWVENADFHGEKDWREMMMIAKLMREIENEQNNKD